MAEILRFRIGDDLLRPPGNARRFLKTSLADRPPRLYVRVGRGVWRRMGSRAAVMERFDRWDRGNVFRVGIKFGGKIKVLQVVRRERVQFLRLANCSPDTEIAWSLVKHQFPGVAFGGGYVYKETSPGEWSDHAWGTAVDPSAYAENDRVTDWVARMTRNGCLDFDYALGSRDDGVVIVFGGSGNVYPSGASRSHLWHVHLSIVNHDGRKPPRTGGVW